tara:strand:+ start:1351 stop:2628 length:1278 start_codon:yes stop_codon:yes gene_type:complete
MTEVGAKVSLKAIGKQDTYLTRDDPEYSFFKYEPKQHANFTKFHRSTPVDIPRDKPNWPFGETVKVTLHPKDMGDLLSNMYVFMKFPGVSGGINLADQLGRHLIKSLKMRVDELVVEIFHADWGIIYDEMYLDASEKRTKRYTLNRNLAEDTSLLAGNALFSQLNSELMIPIPLFFSRKYEGDEYAANKPNRPYFPLCAIHNQKIEFEIEFNEQSFFTDHVPPIKLLHLDIITEEMTVSKEERTFLKTQRQLFVTDIVKKHPSIESTVGSDTLRLELVPDLPVKTINWFLRDTNPTFANRFNFSANTTYSVTNSYFEPVMDSAKIYIKGEDLPNTPLASHPLYKYMIPFNSRLSRPNRNIYTYTFSMNPINVEPSGSLDFGQLQSNKTVLEVKLVPGLTKSYELQLYYVGYQTFVFDNGFMSLAY